MASSQLTEHQQSLLTSVHGSTSPSVSSHYLLDKSSISYTFLGSPEGKVVPEESIKC